MRLSTILAAGYLAAITAFAAAPVFAGPIAATATLAEPAKVDRTVTTGGEWRCNGISCSGASSQILREAVAVCAGIADSVGLVTAFNAGSLRFADAELARCNRHLK